MRQTFFVVAAAAALCGCDPECPGKLSPRTAALDKAAWDCGEWISVVDAPVMTGKVTGVSRAADGTSWFSARSVNAKDVVQAKWMVAGLGTFNVYVNGQRVGLDFLKPGYTHNLKTKYAFTYDVTKLMKTEAGETNALAAEVSAGWWRDKICSPAGRFGFAGRKSAFRGVLELTYTDGTKACFGSHRDNWKAGIAGPVTHAAIYDGEDYDARIPAPCFGEGLTGTPELNTEFQGEVFPSDGGEICLRRDLAMDPVEAYTWDGFTGRDTEAKPPIYGTVVKTQTFSPGETIEIPAGETLVADFGQNCAAVPFFVFESTEGTVLTALPGEMLNEGHGERSRGNDGPAGSIYRENLRIANHGMRLTYTFAGKGVEAFLPRFTFFGYRYISVSATDDVKIHVLKSVPVTSISKCMELGSLTTGNADVNRLIKNVYWGQLSNYLSVPTDCPQRNERLGWTADTQVFTEAGTFNANTSRFFHKWMRDMRDSQDPKGGFPGVAPSGQYGNNVMRLGWSDAGVIVPYQVWKQFGDTKIVDENWAAMEKYVDHVNETRFATEAIKNECNNYQWADWLSYEKLESCGGGIYETDKNGKRQVRADAITYWNYLGACYWMWDAQMMAAMARATGRDAGKFEAMAASAKKYLKSRFFSSASGMIDPIFRDMQTPALFALKLGLVEGIAKGRTIDALRQNFADHGGCLQTGFLGTSILMDTLTANGMADVAYTLLLQHKNPSWLYSVDQGATTIWERWNSYVKKTGFGPVGMNSFNHYAYGSVLAWIYKTVAGIAADEKAPGFAQIVMRPVPDRRLSPVEASYMTPHGLVTSAWHYEDRSWVWTFTVPEGTTALVRIPGTSKDQVYGPGTYIIER